MAALTGFGESTDGVIALPGTIALAGVENLVGEKAEQSGVLFAPEQNAVGGSAVTAGASGFLIILFDGLGQREVDDGAHGGFVDAESESDCADQDANFVGHPALLVAPALIVLHLGV